MATHTWADITRVKSATKPQAPKAEPKVVFHAFCADCGKEADVCRRCDKSFAVYEDGLCGRCLVSTIPSDSMCKGYMDASREAHKIPYKCGSCRKARPWRWEEDKEVVSYSYVQSCFCHKLSPTNVIRVARWRIAGQVSEEQRKAEAMAAYDKEMKFSGNCAEAAAIYKSFFTGRPSI